MLIQEISRTANEQCLAISLMVNKTQACVCYGRDGYVSVLCQNAAHRAYRGCGRTFGNFTDAKAAYRSGEMKTAIQYLEDECVKHFSSAESEVSP